jgi:hypothetical protein
MGNHDSGGRYRRTEQAFVPVDYRSFSLVAGTALAAFSSGDSATPGLVVDDSEAAGVRWNNHGTPAAIAGPARLPADRAPNTDVIVHIKASKTGATVGDATTFAVGVFFHPVGAARDADADAGGATGAMVGNATTKTVQHLTRTIAAADIPNPSEDDPCASFTLTIKPTDGTLGTDDVTIHDVLLEYTRQDLAE